MAGKTEKLYRWTTADGKIIEIPAVTLTGSRPGPRAVITAGVHGCEYPPILAVSEFLRETDAEELCGTATVVTIAAVSSFEEGIPFVLPQDGKNPNRCFPGKEDGSYTESLVWHLYHEIIAGADYHLDLHCGDLTESLAPYCEYGIGHSEETDRASRKMALYSGVKTLIESDYRRDDIGLPPGLNYINSVMNGIPSILFEYGQMGMSGRSHIEGQLFCIRNILRLFGNLPGEALPTEDTQTFVLYVEVDAPEKGIFVRCAEPGQDVDRGEKLGNIYDYFGNLITEIAAPTDGRILYCTSRVAVRKGGFLMNMVDRNYK